LTHEAFAIFSLPYSAEEGSGRAAFVGPWCPAMVNPSRN